MLLAGFAEREYTPAEGVVPGQIEKLYAKGTRTPLMAHVALIESEGRGTALVSLDILFVSVACATRIRESVSKITGYPVEQIMVACTHTHEGCAMDCDVWEYQAAPDAVDHIEKKAAEAAQAAYDSRKEMKIGIGTGFDTRFNFCRDFITKDGYLIMNPGYKNHENFVKPYAAVDHTVNVLRIDDMNDAPKCFIINYANHLDTGSKEKFDADFPGHMRLALQKEFGDDVVVLFLNGCCANVNHFDYLHNSHKLRQNAEGVYPPEVIGKGLAETVSNLCPDIYTSEQDVFINGKSRYFLTARRRASAAQQEWGKALLESLKTAEKGKHEYILADGTKVGMREYLLAELYTSEITNVPPETMDIEIQVLQIGPWTLVGLPGEIYSDIGLKIKGASPFANTVIVEIANGYNGYISPEIVQRSGCYEGRYSNVAYTGPNTEKIIVDGAVGMLNAMFEAENLKVFGQSQVKSKHAN